MPIHSTSDRWILETAHTAYELGLDPEGGWSISIGASA